MAAHARRDGQPVWVNELGLSRLERVRLGQGSSLDEDWLQRQLHAAPSCLPLESVERGLSSPLVSVCREFPTRHGPIDNVFMTGEGDIVIAEVKLWRNPEARRKVVAQALDYASCLFQMSYSEFEQTALRGQFAPAPRPPSLYAHLAAQGGPASADAPDEPEFIDRVSSNLRRGNIVVLVVGDGIREETEQLAATLQSHAALRFTFALIELSVFRLEGQPGYLILPRTLARTRMVERGVISLIQGQPPSVTVPTTPTAVTGSSGTISEDRFFAAMRARHPQSVERIKELLELLGPLGAEPEYQRSLNIKVETRFGTMLNLLIVSLDGSVAINASNSPQLQPMGEEYHQRAAAALGCQVEQFKSHRWMRQNGKWPKIEDLMDRLSGIVEPARRYISEIEARDALEHAGD